MSPHERGKDRDEECQSVSDMLWRSGWGFHDGLRGGYWANQQAAAKGEKLVDESLPAHLQAAHMRHCIDYIRQGIMCGGDTTLEEVDKKVNGVHGFGVQHTCVDWEQLRQWTNQHQ
ncbi:hypothetical protein F5Y01DRAFT_320303 [Xylaria sp. FL0043]|nr:hypothetical protein F5Y01DRAFT_320303 [Xylaria sp. FL0043]